MPSFSGLSGQPWRERLDPPDLTPLNIQDPSSPPYGGDGTTTNSTPLAPVSEMRIMLANRAYDTFQPDPSYANVDPQRGGAPGNPGGNPGSPDASVSFITSQAEDGTTTPGGVPNSPIKRSYGLADKSAFYPTAVQAHLAINRNVNPNRPQVNPTPFNTEGPSQNTNYTTPSPWAQGIFIG